MTAAPSAPAAIPAHDTAEGAPSSAADQPPQLSSEQMALQLELLRDDLEQLNRRHGELSHKIDDLHDLVTARLTALEGAASRMTHDAPWRQQRTTEPAKR